jgi:hypothetical protein
VSTLQPRTIAMKACILQSIGSTNDSKKKKKRAEIDWHKDTHKEDHIRFQRDRGKGGKQEEAK